MEDGDPTRPQLNAETAATSLRGTWWMGGCALLVVALAFRFWRLSWCPGLNGDEAWYGIQAQAFLAGHAPHWTTPTGNPLNPLFFYPTVAVHAVLPPSVTALRLVAAVSGVVALIVNFFCCRPLYGLRAAWLSTLLLAVLPINIANSRIGWDASQTLLVTLPMMYAALAASRARAGRWLVATGIAGAVALVVHPTNIFLAPLAVAAVIEALFRLAKRRGAPPPRLAWWRRAYWTLAVMAAAIWSVAAAGIDGAARYLWQVGRLLSGFNSYEYMAGPDAADVSPWSWQSSNVSSATTAGVLLALASAWLLLARRDRPQDRSLAIGWLMAQVGFLVVARMEQMAPWQERYALWMVAPSTLMVALLASAARPRLSAPVLLVAAATLLAGFYFNFFQRLERSGGDAHRAFRTAPREPKRQLADRLEELAGDGPLWVVAGPWPQYQDQWWIEKPLTYLLHDNPQVRVVSIEQFEESQGQPRGPRGLEEDRVVLAGFCGTPAVTLAEQFAERRGWATRRETFHDAQGRPLLCLTRRADDSGGEERSP